MANSKFIEVSLSFIFYMGLVIMVQGHGRLIEPPSRASMWRYGFNTPPDYSDNQLFCGGAPYQASQKGKCGICGDPYGAPNPEHEAGGKYANGIIVRQYTKNQVIDVTIELTAHHKGWFEFKICPNNDIHSPATQECLDSHVLELENGGTRYQLPQNSGTGNFELRYELPHNMVCEQCVLQWRYHTGNSWSCDDVNDKDTCCVGCGYQEEFYGCADVEIIGTSGPNPTTTIASTTAQASATPATAPSSTITTTAASSSSTSTTAATTSTTAPTTAPPSGECSYVATGAYANSPGMDDWCVTNCNAGYCPASHCAEINCGGTAPSGGGECTYVATGAYANSPGMDDWCNMNCNDGNCPASHCAEINC